MWLYEKLSEEAKSVFSWHKVLQSGEKPILNAKGRVKNLMPYGLYALLPNNLKVMCAEDVSLGTDGKPVNIPDTEAGEVCLYSKGGYILLKNSGEVVINGKTLNME